MSERVHSTFDFSMSIEPLRRAWTWGQRDPLWLGATLVCFGILFFEPARLLGSAWWNDPNSGHGLLLAPVALWLALSAGPASNNVPQPRLGAAVLLLAVVIRYSAQLAAELFLLRGSLLLGAVGLVLWYAGIRQVLRWWLPIAILALSMPIPEVLLNSIALPLQFMASKIGAGLLAWRHIPVTLTGNVIRIPGQELFVAEACSGLRSLTALTSLGVLLGALQLNRWWLRVLLVAITIPVAILINGLRVFLTGFLVLFVSPEMGQGFMHTSEGMMMFGVAFVTMAIIAWLLSLTERRRTPVFQTA